MATYILHTISATATIILVLLLSKQNNIASSGNKSNGYFAFNWNSVNTSRKIMQYWRSDSRRVEAIKKIVWLDYVFMVVYASWFCYSLFVQAVAQHRLWLKNWLQAGIVLVLLCLVTDAVQDYKIYRYVTTGTAVQPMQRYTFFKWGCLAAGLLSLLISLVIFKPQ